MQKHYKCLLWKTLWIISFVSFILAWYTNFNQSVFLGAGALAWFWNSLIIAVLAIPIKLDCHSCDTCQIPK